MMAANGFEDILNDDEDSSSLIEKSENLIAQYNNIKQQELFANQDQTNQALLNQPLSQL